MIPGARRDTIELLDDGTIRIRVTAPAIEGRANAAVCRLLAEALGLRQRDVSIEHGERGRNKIVRVAGTDPVEILSTLVGRSSP